MEFLRSLYDIVSGLGSFLLIPVFFFLLGLASRAGVQRSGQCALAVLGILASRAISVCDRRDKAADSTEFYKELTESR